MIDANIITWSILLGLVAGLFFGYWLAKEYQKDKDRDERIKTLEQRSRVLERVIEEAKNE